MRPSGRVRAVLARGAQVATLGSVAMLVLSTHAFAVGGVADGPQTSPSLAPGLVPTPADAFSIIPPPDARCGGTGADGWRWHTFIVEEGRDVSGLRFGPFGPGDDYDASDGGLTAGLIAAGNGVWNKVPALKPEGLVNPNELGGLILDPSTYRLRDGDYEIGFACTDATVKTRQWWSVTVSIATAGEPFLSVAGEGATIAAPSTAPAPPTTTELATVDSPEAAADSAADSATDAGVAQGISGSTADLSTSAAISTAIDLPSPAGISWAPLLALTDVSSHLPTPGWAVLAAVFARIAYLLSRPVRVLAPLSP